MATTVGPEEMDLLWSMGWRHFGKFFFRYSTAEHHSAVYHVVPLRVAIDKFIPSRSQKRIIRKNHNLQVVVRDTFIDSSKEALFDRHRQRFKHDRPRSLYDVLSTEPATVPCRNQEICVYRDDQLLAFSFLDIGKTSTSAVYAAFDPSEHKLSPGIFTMLCAIEHSGKLGAHYYYPGYAYREPSFYDYKKKFAGLEFLDWATNWRRMPGQ